LDDLDNLWQSDDDEERDSLTRRILALADRNHPVLVRALAAAALGRIGAPGAAGALAAMVEAGEKPVSESASWGLRQFCNRGAGLDRLAAALGSGDERARRGAARVLAYQFWALDGRAELLDAEIRLLSDPDLLTRIQSVRTLEQWWYRTPNTGARRRIV